MSRLYDTVEPAVIDEDMLQNAVEEQGPKDEAGRIAKAEGIDFADVTQLRLDFKSKWSIQIFYALTSTNSIFLVGAELLADLFSKLENVLAA